MSRATTTTTQTTQPPLLDLETPLDRYEAACRRAHNAVGLVAAFLVARDTKRSEWLRGQGRRGGHVDYASAEYRRRTERDTAAMTAAAERIEALLETLTKKKQGRRA